MVAVPKTLQQRVIAECHGDNVIGHGGIRKTVLAVRERYHFKGIRKLVTKYVNKCVKCKRAKTHLESLEAPLMPMVSSHPFRVIAIDIYSPGRVTAEGYKYILTVVDMCTHWVLFLPLRTKYPAEVMMALILVQQAPHPTLVS